MDQSGDHTKHLYQHKEAVEKIREITSDGRIGMLCTNLTKAPFSTCPMATQTVDDDGTIWFFSTRNSDHNSEIAADSRVQLLYANPDDDSYLSLYGKAEILYDRAKVDELWNPYVKVWFQGGKDDPNLSLLKFTPSEGYYWDTKNGQMVAFLKRMASLVTGKTMDDSIEGKIKP